MPDTTFQALVLRQQEKLVTASVEELRTDQLPEGEVLIQVAYSSLNYKDGLAVTGQGRIARFYPMVPGIDLAGTVVESSSPRFGVGDPVVMTGCGGSETFWGGYTQRARLPEKCLTPLPEGMTLKQAMGVGTAGFTAMQSVMALEAHGLTPGGSEVIVTGAGGGVGSIAVALLSNLGYKTVASTGRAELHGYLNSLGASRILDRSTLGGPFANPPKPLEPEQCDGAVDSVGGETLASVIRALAVGASVAACGLAGGGGLPTTVHPFILRGVNLLGIDSVRYASEKRPAVWQRLRRDLPLDLLDSMIQVAPLSRVAELAPAILKGQVRGRTVIDLNA